MSVLSEMRSRPVFNQTTGIQHCEPSKAAVPRSGPGWIHKIKHDGFRILVRRDGVGLRMLTRNGYDWSGRYKAITAAANAISATSFLIDGEVVVCDDNGLAVFEMLRKRTYDHVANLYAFDLLELNGKDFRREPNRAAQGRAGKAVEEGRNWHPVC
jgi:ATP-dependent DNA ligase